MHLVRAFLVSVFLVAAHSAWADSFHELIKYTCDPKGDFVQVEYLGGYNEKGESLSSQTGKNAWNPWELIVGDGSGRYVKSSRTVRRSCTLSDGRYGVTIKSLPCNTDTQGQGGAMITAIANFTKKDGVTTSNVLGACAVVDVQVTTKVLLRPGKPPYVERKSGDEFYQ